MNSAQLVVITKAPAPGAVKTRLCPPYTPEQAAALAAAALADIVAAVNAAPAARRVLLLDGAHPAPPSWEVVAQRGDGLAQRLANGFQDASRPGLVTLVIAGDAPQVSPGTLATATDLLARDDVDAALGPTDDGGFWALGLRDPRHGRLLCGVPMSTARTGARTLAVLRDQGLRVAWLPQLRDVDTAADVAAVAAACPRTRFAATVRSLAPPRPSAGQFMAGSAG